MLAFALGLGAGVAIALLARTIETSRLAFGPYAFYGNGALIVPPLGAGLALYGLWTWVLRSARPRLELALSALGVHLGLGLGLFLTGGTSLEGLFFTGLLFVVPTALAAFTVVALLESRLAPGRGTPRAGALIATGLVALGLVLTVVPFPPLGVGVIAGVFIALARRASREALIGLGALLVVVLLAAALGVPLLFLR